MTNRRFWGVLAATGVSSVGDGLVLVGFPLLALTMTHDPLAIAAVVIFGRLPALLLALPVGALADRTDRRRLAVAIEAMRAASIACFGLVVLSGHGSLAALYVAAFVLGGLTVAFDVVASACLPSLVPVSALVESNAKLMTAELSGEELVGQALGGAAFSAARSLPFIGDAVSSVASAVLVWRSVAPNPARKDRSSLLADVVAGLRYLAADRALRALSSLLATLAYCQAMVLGVMAIYATERLHLGPGAFGIFLAVAGAGNILGAALAPRLHRTLGSEWSIVGAAATAVAAYGVLASTTSSIVAAVALLAETGAVLVGNVAARSMRQSTVPDALQGRAASAFQTVVLTALPLGSLTGGALAATVGTPLTFAAAAGLQIVVVSLLAPRLLSSRRHAAGSPLVTVDIDGIEELEALELGELAR